MEVDELPLRLRTHYYMIGKGVWELSISGIPMKEWKYLRDQEEVREFSTDSDIIRWNEENNVENYTNIDHIPKDFVKMCAKTSPILPTAEEKKAKRRAKFHIKRFEGIRTVGFVQAGIAFDYNKQDGPSFRFGTEKERVDVSLTRWKMNLLSKKILKVYNEKMAIRQGIGYQEIRVNQEQEAREEKKRTKEEELFRKREADLKECFYEIKDKLLSGAVMIQPGEDDKINLFISYYESWFPRESLEDILVQYWKGILEHLQY